MIDDELNSLMLSFLKANEEKKAIAKKEREIKAQILKDISFDKSSDDSADFELLKIIPKKDVSIANAGYAILHSIHQENFIHEPWPFKVKCEVILPLLSECSEEWMFEISKQITKKPKAPLFEIKGN